MPRQKKRRIAILVAGMHRSGTSAIARLLSIVGCDLPKTLMSGKVPNESNVTGFWESQRVVDLNDEILVSAGSAWNDWRPFDSNWYASPVADEFRERARTMLLEEFGDSRLFVLKDPRICYLLEFWIEAIRGAGADALVVSPIRNPADVAASLKARDGIDPSIGYLLWLRYVLDAEAASRHLQRAYVRYDTLLSETHATVDAVGDTLGISWPRCLSVDVQMEIDGFLSPELRHHRIDDTKLMANPRISRWILSSFEIFDRWCRGESHEKDVATLSRIRSAFDAAVPIFSFPLAASERAITERDGRIEELLQNITERDGRIEELLQNITERDGRIEELYGSTSWRITAPIRHLGRIVRFIFTKGISGSSRIVRTIYRRIPLPYSLKMQIKADLFRLIPFLFKHTLAYWDWLVFNSVHRTLPDPRENRSTLEPAELLENVSEITLHDPNLSNEFASSLSSQIPLMQAIKPSHWDRLRQFAMRGQLTKGWYGGRELRLEETVSAVVAPPPRAILKLGGKVYKAGTRLIESRYFSTDDTEKDGGYLESPALRYAPVDEIRTFLGSREPPNSVVEMADCSGFTIVTPFYRHLDLFGKTIASVSQLAREESTAGSALEWVIVNDDPDVSDEELARRIPERLNPAIRQIRPDGKGGIVDALNSGIRHGRHRWTLFLDCDDEIEPNAIMVLKHYLKQFPRCRYVSSSMTDIDEQGNTLRFRGNEAPVNRLFDIGMLAGHLKAVRRDLFDDIGYLDPYFELCQDYEFALRTAMQEPILKIPEPLYRYRWHARTLSVSQAERQKAVHQRIQREYMRRFLSLREGRERDAAMKVRPCSSRSDMPCGAVIVRTRNRRPDLLAEAVESVRIQPRLTPVVVVHGNEDDLQTIKNQISGGGMTDFLLASERLRPGRRLGYPANVALDYITGRPDRFDYVCFLDDDDILYPCFAARMSEALAWSGADLVYGMTNRRLPWQPAETGHMPLPSSCLVADNFITCNSYALTTEFLRHCGARFDEYKLYLDDWDFLLTLWGAGARFQFIAEIVAEYRIMGDGQLPVNKKRYPKLWEANTVQVKDKAWKIARTTKNGLARFQRDMLDFDWSELRHARQAERISRDAHEIWIKAKRYREDRSGGSGR